MRKILAILMPIFFIACGDPKLDLPEKLLPEFNICDQWKADMSWADFQAIRTDLKRPELIKYVNKIEVNKWVKQRGLEVVPVIFSSNKKDNFIDYIKDRHTYVAKPSHMSQNNGLIIVKNGINLITNKTITPEQVQKEMHKLIDTPSNSNEWLLQNMPRGFLIQEFIEGRQEIKIQTIWGKAREVVWVRGGSSMIENFYDVDGDPLGNSVEFPFTKELLKKAITIAEKVAENTDALRVDILVRFNYDGTQDLLVNELELRSQVGFKGTKLFAELLNRGYKIVCAR